MTKDEPPTADAAFASTTPAPPAPPPRSTRRRWKWAAILLSVFIFVPALIFAAWSWVSLTWTYSGGDRAGYVQKISRKGWLCKTWEGELSQVNVPGAAQDKWLFTVRNDSIAHLIQQSMGNKVALAYEEHRGVPTACFGDTQYFVTGIRKVSQ